MPERAECDVLIAGAGLVGLSLAAALADCGLSLALTDRNALTTAEWSGPDDWDARIYAISPGSADYLRSIGAWQRIPCERVQPIESMLVQIGRAHV